MYIVGIIAAQLNREIVCEECRHMVQMMNSTISRMEYGSAPTQAEADSIAMNNARKELIELLRDSVAPNANGIISATAAVCMTGSLHREILSTKHFFVRHTRKSLHISRNGYRKTV